jgi:glycosyltransferase involved in cell wall biosynthesis
MVIVPALNEEQAIACVVHAVQAAVPGVPILVIDDYSEDGTAMAAAAAGAQVVRLPVHLGLGGCVQTGYKLAYELGYDYVIRVDGDGQHEAADIPKVYAALLETGAEIVIGSRFVDSSGNHTSFMRSVGIVFFRLLLRPLLGRAIYDPTSGFVGVNRRALQVFARTFPLEYPEIEALVVLQRRRFRFHEIPCRMYARATGQSTITRLRSVLYMVHVLLGVFINALKIDAVARSKESKP